MAVRLEDVTGLTRRLSGFDIRVVDWSKCEGNRVLGIPARLPPGAAAGKARRGASLLHALAFPSATEAVLAESAGHDLLVLGATARGARPGESPFGAVIDEVVRDASCPTMIVRSAVNEDISDPVPIDRVLLPTTGTQYNRHANEIAFTIAREHGAAVEVVTIVSPPLAADQFVDRPDMASARDLGAEIVDAEADLGRTMGAMVTTNVIETEREPHEELVHLAAKGGYDLVVLGSSIRPTTQRAFFGHRVEHVLQNAVCPVTVVSSR